MNKKILLLPLLALLASCSRVEPSSSMPSLKTINGTVSAYGEVVEGVEVSIRSLSYSDTTDSDGAFSIQLSESDSNASSYTVIAEMDGYNGASYVVRKSDFNNGIANINLNIELSTIRIFGEVKDGDAPIEDVEVNIGGYEITHTNALGQYDITIERPLNSFTIQYFKQYYDRHSEIIDPLEIKEVNKDINLSKTRFSVSGSVHHYFFKELSGVNVSILDTEYTTITDEDGLFSFSDITNINLPLTLKFEKEGYQSRVATWNSNNEILTVEMISTPVVVNNIAPTIAGFSGNIARSHDGLHFYFESEHEMRYSKEENKEEKLQIYVDVNDTSANRMGDTVVEFALTSNNSIIVVWNHKTNSPVTMLDWDHDVVYTSVISEDKTILSLYVSYKAFSDIGEDFAINNDAVVGFAFGYWSDFVTPNWEGWSVDNILGHNGISFVEPADPRDYVRCSPEGKLYQNNNNEYVVPRTRTIKGVIKDEENNPLSGAIIKVKDTALGVMSGNDGTYEIVLENEYIAVKPTLNITKEGYLVSEVTIEDEEFSNDEVIKDIVLEASSSLEADCGTFGIAPWRAYASMGNDKLTFRLVTEGEFEVPGVGENNVSIYVAFGETKATQQESNVLEFKFNPNNWIGVWNYKINGWQLWKPDVAYSISKIGAITELTVSVTYAYINDIDGFTINPGDEVGISFGQWIDGNDPVWLGWSYEGLFVDPAIPTSYIRLNKNNQLSKPN